MYSVFLFVLAFIALIFAVAQDLKTREIANWLNFSLLSAALAYRALYSLYYSDLHFFLLGLVGTLFFASVAYVLYYTHAFAGGDAKLLIALGAVLPFTNVHDLIIYGLGFVFALFVLGSLYSLVYTFFLVRGNFRAYQKAFATHLTRLRYFFFILACLGILGCVFLFSISLTLAFVFLSVCVIVPLIYVHARAVEQTCMIKRISATRLTEGDWLEQDVSVGTRIIRKSVHGLSLEDIALLRKARKSVYIKEGIPFSPAFLFAFIAMVFYVLG